MRITSSQSIVHSLLLSQFLNSLRKRILCSASYHCCAIKLASRAWFISNGGTQRLHSRKESVVETLIMLNN